MYTKCPECQISFRVTAKILQRAGGDVRCGNCNHAFSALAYLTEDLPDAPVTGGSPAPVGDIGDKLAETSRRLLDTLDELAGPGNVRIEDTGVEWRVLDEEELPVPDSAGEQRYDDNTPLPDDFGADDEGIQTPLPTQRRDEEHARVSEQFSDRQQDLALSEPEDWTDLLDEVREPEDDALQEEEALAATHTELADGAATLDDDDGEAADLDLEVGDADGDAGLDLEVAASGEAKALDLELEAPGQAGELDLEIEPAAELQVLDLDVDEQAQGPGLDFETESLDEADEAITDAVAADEDADANADPDADSDTDADANDREEEHEAPAEPVLTVLADGSTTEERIPEREDADLQVPEPTEEEMTINMEIDQELLAAAADDGFAATLVGLENPEEIFEQNPEEVETIIMEGEFIRTAMDKERLAAENATQERVSNSFNPEDTYTLSRENIAGHWRIRRPGAGMTAGAIILLAVLGLQFVHYSRESLATTGFFNQAIAPVYRMLGMPVTPAWDISGWQFEATNGSVNEEGTLLTIVSRLGNRSPDPLPYPLLHVSLTDRWEDIMGSRVLEPSDYLPDQLDPSRPVQSGDNFTAVIPIQSPSIEATGFKLNVCYRVAPGSVRCAIQDFKN